MEQSTGQRRQGTFFEVILTEGFIHEGDELCILQETLGALYDFHTGRYHPHGVSTVLPLDHVRVGSWPLVSPGLLTLAVPVGHEDDRNAGQILRRNSRCKRVHDRTRSFRPQTQLV